MADKLSHISNSGEARMVNVGEKAETERLAMASGKIIMHAETLKMILKGNAKKGDVIGTARIAGIMAGKRTADLIPLCHPLSLNQISVDIDTDDTLPGLVVTASARLTGKTGVEMEALTACSVALLTLYDMAKAVDRGMRITDIEVLEKSGGKSGHWTRDDGNELVRKGS